MEPIGLIDPGFDGRRGHIAVAAIRGPEGLALVDPGPASSLDGLERGLAEAGADGRELRAILVTHIHLDHAGAVGSLVERHPHVRVFVHARGARHLVDPGRLVESASRLYGEAMERLWGEMRPVPAGNVEPLSGGEELRVAGRLMDVAYTPGHAWHHVSFFDRESRVAFVGDVGGMSAGTSQYLFPPTPPPDIDVEAWLDSLDRILAWQPDALFVTHFGFVDRPAERLDALRRLLVANAEIARLTLEQDISDDERAARFTREVRAEVRKHLSEEEVLRHTQAVPLAHAWHGLARYWRRRASHGPAPGDRA